MPLEIIRREQQGIEILSLKGQLTFGQEDLDLRRQLESLIETGKINMVFDLTHLSRLDDIGLATVLNAREKLLKAGGAMAIFSAEPLKLDSDLVEQLETAVAVFGTEQEAIDSFFPDEAIKHYDVLELVQSFKMNNAKA